VACFDFEYWALAGGDGYREVRLGAGVTAAENVQNYGVAELVMSAKWQAPSRDQLIRAVVASIVKGSSKK